MPKCSCDVKYPMVFSMVWILLSYAKGFLWRILWCPLCYVTSHDVTLVCFIPAFPDVVHPMICQSVLIVWSIL
ncbi:hypothetical protein CEXT_19751 [Caerostris extrusa]|uniref:Uncharacterized protein n=1 Tax=Caerostris extrusa TaxID=172846 RepID=A0AAV4TKP9_CAEEX|nr:hypothetical protein CEXT_19751 [Caerostris extrusa]